MDSKKILLLSLHTFSLTGGIEKVCRSVTKILSDWSVTLKNTPAVMSMYDEKPDTRYTANTNFKGFNGRKWSFLLHAIKAGLNADIIILSHINLLSVAWIIKKLKPQKRIILFAHGIEIWGKLSPWKTSFIKNNVEIWAVSRYTADQIMIRHHIPKTQVSILNNCLDPFFDPPAAFKKPKTLLEKYHLPSTSKVLFTLTRLSHSEQYKGYDQVLATLKDLPKDVYYILSGKADAIETKRITDLIAANHLTGRVLLTGFLPEEDVIDHFLLADVFVMPSKGEGFGIAFIEAAACGCNVIAGNQDGSSDALLDGDLGTLVHPERIAEIKSAILSRLEPANSNQHAIQQKCLDTFGFQRYQENILKLLNLSSIPSING
ncbi:glycosyltransferase family 1 protein [Pedobacter chinensis]|uniref:Glycosyltransferase family 1 protein n=1 Tax=Pedobacter chinensis TaxID=2282421 RepID=A0A369PZV9_9SPHI|nr:glycosyltransferase family 4 protein [Pedobacter chinensis]RDC56229.1 glycosyltransferase family 1 protein [Pedobacter chinensis]